MSVRAAASRPMRAATRSAYSATRPLCPAVYGSRASIVLARVRMTCSACSCSSANCLSMTRARTRGSELLGREGLGEEVGHALGLRADLLRRGRRAGQHDDRQQARRGIGPDLFEHLVAAAVGKLQVEQNEVRRVRPDELHGADRRCPIPRRCSRSARGGGAETPAPARRHRRPVSGRRRYRLLETRSGGSCRTSGQCSRAPRSVPRAGTRPRASGRRPDTDTRPNAGGRRDPPRQGRNRRPVQSPGGEPARLGSVPSLRSRDRFGPVGADVEHAVNDRVAGRAEGGGVREPQAERGQGARQARSRDSGGGRLGRREEPHSAQERARSRARAAPGRPARRRRPRSGRDGRAVSRGGAESAPAHPPRALRKVVRRGTRRTPGDAACRSAGRGPSGPRSGRPAAARAAGPRRAPARRRRGGPCPLSPPMAKSRETTRVTLASTAGTRAPKAIEATAAAM